MRLLIALLAGISLAFAAQRPAPVSGAPGKLRLAKATLALETHDTQSYAEPQSVRTTHISLDLSADFDRKILHGSAVLKLIIVNPKAVAVALDTRDLDILKTEASQDGRVWKEVSHVLAAKDPILGSKLTVSLPKGDRYLRVDYRTSPGASGLQWLSPEQTAGKRLPFMFSQSEAIHARSWIPCQDSPGIRITYSAVIHTPKELRAVMSADNDPGAKKTGSFRFTMPNPIPSYLLAIAIGDLDFQSLGKRTGVYAEPSVLPKAAKELEDTEKMVAATEKLYGPYAWGRYDILVLPPSFPYGGMENPRLTFATPTILAGDKSLVSLIAHELAHSWSGNLVTNATWNDVWLNEGITTYVERRIVEAIYGRDQEEMQAALGRQSLQHLVETLLPGDTVLRLVVNGRDPDESLSEIPYEKGALFLRTLEEAYGRKIFDGFLRGYFRHFTFHSISTPEFEAYLQAHLVAKYPAKGGAVPIHAWLYDPGVPALAAVPRSDAFEKIEAQMKPWLQGSAPSSSIRTGHWSTQEWQHFLLKLPGTLRPGQMKELDEAFHFTEASNAEIAFLWLQLCIRHSYAPADSRLQDYLIGIGRLRLIVPLYQELAKTPQGKSRALEIYRKARLGYHPAAQSVLDQLLGFTG